jgi:hypothetical protein
VTAAPQSSPALWVFGVADLAAAAAPIPVGGPGMLNLPEGAIVAGPRLIVANTPNNKILMWNNIEDAARRRPPDLVLGGTSAAPEPPRIGRSTMFWPGTVAFDGSYLWVGEYKFSNRVLRFNIEPD